MMVLAVVGLLMLHVRLGGLVVMYRIVPYHHPLRYGYVTLSEVSVCTAGGMMVTFRLNLSVPFQHGKSNSNS